MTRAEDSIRSRMQFAGVALAAMGLWASAANGATVGHVFFASGSVVARGADGNVRVVAKGAEILNGDQIETGAGRAQLRFTDGALVSLQPESQFRVDEYRFTGAADGTEKGFFSLLKGGLRTITGLVGRFNRDAYQINTPTATIGIRGTEYLAKLGNSLIVSVGEGRVAVINGTGEFIVEAGQSVYVKDQDSRPEVTSEKPFLPPPGTQAGNTPPALPGYVAGDQYVNVGGDWMPAWLAASPTMAGAQQEIAIAGANERTPDKLLIPISAAGTGVVDCDASGVCRKLEPAGFKFIANSVSTFESGYDGIIGWGRWAGGRYNVTSPLYGNTNLTDQQGLHYVFGAPTPATEFQKLGAASYRVLGATNATSLEGTLTGGKFSAGLAGNNVIVADFTNKTMDIGFQVSFTRGPTYNVSGKGLVPTPQFAFSGPQLTTTGGGCTSGCTSAVNGFFAGPAAERAGLAYQITDSATTVSGAAALTK